MLQHQISGKRNLGISNYIFELSKVSSLNIIQLYRIQIDYSELARDLRKKNDPDDIKKTTDKMTKSVNSLEDTIHRIQAPNLKVLDYFILKKVKIFNKFMYNLINIF